LSVLVVNRLQKQELKGRTITLKVKYHDFKQITRSRSFLHGIDDEGIILETALSLLQQTETENVKVRLLGISLSNFGEAKPNVVQELPNDQLTLF